jgi:hypothetical protein
MTHARTHHVRGQHFRDHRVLLGVLRDLALELVLLALDLCRQPGGQEAAAEWGQRGAGAPETRRQRGSGRCGRPAGATPAHTVGVALALKRCEVRARL